MKIGVFTIFRCVNYGAVLQAMALQTVLTRLFPAAEIEVINHLMDFRDNHLLGKITNPNTPRFQRWRNKRRFSKRYFKHDLFELRREKTIALIGRFFSLSSRLYKSPQEFSDLKHYDVVVVGSDQVWNPVLNHDFPVNQYLCSTFPREQRRVSYAASFGVNALPSRNAGEYKAALSKFAKISVREETGAEIVSDLLGSRPRVVLDPTMLMDANEWMSLFSDSRLSAMTPSRHKPYVFAYWVGTVTQEDVDALSQFADLRSCEVRLAVAGQLPKLKFSEGVVPCLDADPVEWVQLLANSSGVVTDSFHGLQFAVNFSKPVLPLVEIKGVSTASRLVDFCARLGMPDACRSLEEFRSGAVLEMSDGFDLCRLKADRQESLLVLQEVVQT